MNIYISGLGEFHIGCDRKSIDEKLNFYYNDNKDAVNIEYRDNETILYGSNKLDIKVHTYYINDKLILICVFHELVDGIDPRLFDRKTEVPYCVQFGLVNFDKLTDDKCEANNINYCTGCTSLIALFNTIEDKDTILFYKHSYNGYPPTITLRELNIDKYTDRQVLDMKYITLE